MNRFGKLLKCMAMCRMIKQAGWQRESGEYDGER